MPRFIVCAAIPLFDRGPINPAVPDQPSARAARSGGPGVLRPARYRVPLALRRQARRHLSVFGTALRLLLE